MNGIVQKWHRPEKHPGVLADCEIEFEFSYNGEVLKRFRVLADGGARLGLVLPLHRLKPGRSPTPELIAEAGSLHSYIQRKCALLEEETWSGYPAPSHYAIVSNCRGYGDVFGGRTCDAATIMSLTQTCRALGINAWEYLREVLGRIMSHNSNRVDELLPGNRKEARKWPSREAPLHPSPGRAAGGWR